MDGASSGGKAGPLDSHVGGGVAGGEGVVVGEDHVFGAAVAEGGLVVAADDGEGVEDVGGVGAGEAVEVEVEGVEAGAQVAARSESGRGWCGGGTSSRFKELELRYHRDVGINS